MSFTPLSPAHSKKRYLNSVTVCNCFIEEHFQLVTFYHRLTQLSSVCKSVSLKQRDLLFGYTTPVLPDRNFLVQNINGKWLYWGLVHIIEIVHDYVNQTTSGKFKIIYINTRELITFQTWETSAERKGEMGVSGWDP